MLRRKWGVTIVFETNDTENHTGGYAEGYVKKHEEMLSLLGDIEKLIVRRAKKLNFVQFVRDEGGVIHLGARIL